MESNLHRLVVQSKFLLEKNLKFIENFIAYFKIFVFDV